MPINSQRSPELMTNHQKTEMVTSLVDNYNFFENVLVNLGLEVVVVTMRAKRVGYPVGNITLKETNEEREAFKNTRLDGSGIDWE